MIHYIGLWLLEWGNLCMNHLYRDFIGLAVLAMERGLVSRRVWGLLFALVYCWHADDVV